MPSSLSYIDTCCVMMFVNKTDSLRSTYSIGNKKAEGCVKSGQREFCIPMPALGEAICKIRDKCGSERTMEALEEMNRLMDEGFLRVRYINDPSATFGLARSIAREVDDDRDAISPMDALILAAAATEQDCSIFYSTDVKLVSDCNVSQIVNDWREGQGLGEIKLLGISSVLR